MASSGFAGNPMFEKAKSDELAKLQSLERNLQTQVSKLREEGVSEDHAKLEAVNKSLTLLQAYLKADREAKEATYTSLQAYLIAQLAKPEVTALRQKGFSTTIYEVLGRSSTTERLLTSLQSTLAEYHRLLILTGSSARAEEAGAGAGPRA